MYRSANRHYQEKFGEKVYRLSLDGGFTCPNRDGTLGTGGCIFCAGDGSGAFAQRAEPDIASQLEKAKAQVEGKFRGSRYMAYFQSFTNTYAPVEVLEQRFTQAMAPGWIVGLTIGTRPDCLEPEKIDLLARLNRIKPVTVELGLQTIHPQSVRYIRRGYDNAVYDGAVQALKSAGIEVVSHIILGLPGETAAMAAQTTRYAVERRTDGVKFHLLHVLQGTDLARDYQAGKVTCLTLEEYAQWLKACLREVPPEVTVYRITGDGAKADLIAPLWSADKKRVLNYLNRSLVQQE